jgi:hypothetical protein
VVRSLALVDYLPACPKLIICDGYKVRDKSKFRSGEVTEERASAYLKYKLALRELTETPGSIFDGALLLELDERMGFGFAMREGVPLVTTPYMIVVQHDRNFRGSFDLLRLVAAMRRHRSWLHYVGLPTARTIKHAPAVLSKYRLRLFPVVADVHGAGAPSARTEDAAHQLALDRLVADAAGPAAAAHAAAAHAADGAAQTAPDDSAARMKLVPMVQWYDSTHVASTAYYRRFVFDRRAKRVAKGGFIEDKLGQQQLKVILERGMAAHASYGTFILDDGNPEPVVSHLDGHDPRNAEKFVFAETE